MGAEGGDSLTGMASRAMALASRFTGVLFPGADGPWGMILTFGVAAVGGVGLYRLSRASWTPVLTAGLMVVLLWMWPYQERRLIMPVVPLLALILICGFQSELGEMRKTLWRRVAFRSGGVGDDGRAGSPGGGPGRRVRTTAVGVLGLFWIVWLAGTSLLHRRDARHLEAFNVRSRMLARAVLAVEGRVPENGVVGAPELWAGLALHTGRTVAPSARFHPAGEGPVWGTNREQYEVWDAAGIEYVLLEDDGRVHKDALDELDVRYPGSVELLASWGGGMLVRLDWDETCRSQVLTGS